MGPRQQRPSQLKDSFGTSGRAITEPLHKNIYTAKRDGRPLRSVRGGGGVPALSRARARFRPYAGALTAGLRAAFRAARSVLSPGPPAPWKPRSVTRSLSP